jgi:DNA-binding MarR family transcriptional regulator
MTNIEAEVQDYATRHNVYKEAEIDYLRKLFTCGAESDLTPVEAKFIDDLKQWPYVLRTLMSRSEIRIAERLVKRGLVRRGTPDEKGRCRVMYYCDKSGNGA